VTQSWWGDVDAAVLSALEAAGGRLTLAEIANRAGMSEDAVRSVIAMLAEQGLVRIAAVELTPSLGLARAPGRIERRRPVGRRVAR
jgi:DNA-binding IclR family transcriptional regulator